MTSEPAEALDYYYNARRECQLTHGQMAELESWPREAPYWM